MKSTDVFPSRYLKAEELDEDLTLTMERVELETMKTQKGEEQDKPVLYFAEVEKGLVLNKTNWGLIAKQHGDESDNWPGKQITLTVVDVDSFGDVVSAIRIKPQRKVSANPIRATATQPHANGNHVPDPATAFWSFAYQHDISKPDANAYLTESGNDFAKALDLMQLQTAES